MVGSSVAFPRSVWRPVARIRTTIPEKERERKRALKTKKCGNTALHLGTHTLENLQGYTWLHCSHLRASLFAPKNKKTRMDWDRERQTNLQSLEKCGTRLQELTNLSLWGRGPGRFGKSVSAETLPDIYIPMMSSIELKFLKGYCIMIHILVTPYSSRSSLCGILLSLSI